MARWDPGARQRLARAALDLFAERGYDATTVADIAERAGLTQSTFFRHFIDKREVLFAGGDEMATRLSHTTQQVPPDALALGCVATLLLALADFFPAEQRGMARTRAAVIDTHPELRERELLKSAQLRGTIESAVRSRGVDELTARLTATIGLLAMETALGRWIAADDESSWSYHVTRALDELAQRAFELGRARAVAV